MKTLRGFIAFLFIMSGIPLFAQAATVDGKTNSLFDPVAVVQRLSYDNFKNIKMLMTAIMNYGGGEAEFSKLVSGYADASSYYFSRDFDKAADAFAKNEKDIKEVAQRLAEKYKKDTTDLNRGIIKFHIEKRVRQSIEGKKSPEAMATAEQQIRYSSEALAKANDEFERAHPVVAISLYRRAKDNVILYYETLGLKEADGQKIDERFAREKADNKNKMYIAKEKKN